MEFRSRGRTLKLSFDTLSKLSSNGDLEDALRMSTSSRAALSASESDARTRKRRNRGSRKRRKKATDEISTFDHPIAEDECGFAGVDDLTDVRCENGGVELEQDCVQSAVFQEALVPQECGARTTAVEEVAEAWSSGKLRQRNRSGSGGRMEEVEVVSSSDVPYENGKEVDVKGIDFSLSSNMKKSELNENGIGRLETVESLDWKQIMAEDPHLEIPLGIQRLLRMRMKEKECMIQFFACHGADRRRLLRLLKFILGSANYHANKDLDSLVEASQNTAFQDAFCSRAVGFRLFCGDVFWCCTFGANRH